MTTPNSHRRLNAGNDGETPFIGPRRKYNNTDAGNAQRFADQHGSDVRFCFESGQWFVFDGRRWATDLTGEIHRRAKQTAKSIYREAEHEVDTAVSKELGSWAIRSEGRGSLMAMIDLAKSEKPIPIYISDLDTHSWLLNCANGTLDLLTGMLREHRKEDFITKICPIEYPTADAPPNPKLFQEFLNRIFAGNQPLINYVQRLLGSSLVGEVLAQKLPIFWGQGANGKSTLVETVCHVLGSDFAMKAPPGFLMASKNDRHPTELADLRGMRFVFAVETEDGKRLAEARVKELTGDGVLRARCMGQDFFQFKTSHTLILVTNPKPVVRGTDHAMWRRLHLVPFDVTIPESEQDQHLKGKLLAEAPAILAWLVAGCLEWQKDGLGAPDEVVSATEEYKRESDVLVKFIEECCVVAPDEKVWAKEIYPAYDAWAKSRNEYTMTKTEFGRRLGATFESKKSGTNFYRGLGLRPERAITSNTSPF